jgi:hypothetical protein
MKRFMIFVLFLVVQSDIDGCYEGIVERGSKTFGLYIGVKSRHKAILKIYKGKGKSSTYEVGFTESSAGRDRVKLNLDETNAELNKSLAAKMLSVDNMENVYDPKTRSITTTIKKGFFTLQTVKLDEKDNCEAN